ncbi:MAG: hypothetical protein JRD93_01220 [Deltaproteobacteria bacterium]|nr:hypothetical protein [Deltaproteobacteria bacterium]MBW2660619.1 hypothetical protein [Deltaproteobacteria bacterium]
MKKKLKTIFFISLGLSIIIGFPIHKHHIAFFWHEIPCIDAILGITGTLVLIGAKKIVAFLAQREESFYD